MLLTDRWLAFLPKPGTGPVEPAGAPPFGGSACRCLTVGAARIWADCPASQTAASQPLRLIDTVRGSHERARDWAATLSRDDLQDALQVFTEIRETAPGHLVLASDFLGLRPVYLKRTATGWWLSNRVDLLRRATGGEVRGDRQAALEFFFLLAPLGRRTMEADIERLYCGDEVYWSAEDGPSLRAHGLQLTLGAASPDEHPDAVIPSLRQALADSVMRKQAWHGRQPVLALSGGYDSRVIAAMFVSMGNRPQAYTYGHRHHHELWAARRIAARLGLRLDMVPYPDDMLRTRLPLYFELLQGQADPHVMHLANLLAMPEPDGTAVAHGFLGDALSGAFLCGLPPQSFASFDALADGIAKRFAFPVLERVAEAAGFTDPATQLRQAISESLNRSAGSVYQAAMLWNLENRQRRFIATQADILGPRFAPFYPFYDRRYMELWLAQPLMAHTGRSLLRQFLQTCFPRVATIPHPNESTAFTPSLRDMLEQYVRDRLIGWRRKASQLTGQLTGEAPPNPDIMRLSYGGETAAIRQAMVQDIARGSHRLAGQFGLAPPADLLRLCFPGSGEAYEGLHALRRLWAIAHYAVWAAEPAASPRIASVAELRAASSDAPDHGSAGARRGPRTQEEAELYGLSRGVRLRADGRGIVPPSSDQAPPGR